MALGRLIVGWLVMFFCGVVSADDLRINQIQFVGSHNSYKQAMSGVYRTMLGLVDADAAKSLDYQHVPLTEQLDLGLRKLELDVFYQPEQGTFPVGHIQVIDMNTHCATLRECLERLEQWSKANPSHAPIWISFNAKDQKIGWLPDPTVFDAVAFTAMDRVLEETLGLRLIRPAQVKKPTVSQPDWPLLADAMGKFVLILDEGGSKRQHYLDGWQGRPMFVNVDPDHAAAAIMIVNDPINDFERIQTLVKSGFMVRTRADANTLEARANDTRRRAAALASGAQAISTDYYLVQNPFANDYRVAIEGGLRCNPLTAPAECQAEWLAQ